SDPYAGLYLDGSVQRAQFRNRVQGLALDAECYDTRAWQGAIEAGYAFRLSKDDKSNVYLEPELQVGYSRWDNYRHSESNGTDVAAHNAGGLFGRIG
ncbi:autotransporter outer membrane beta-barrel domain-containing protein, partial [Mesorhizobium sp. M1C.F.Ca.ET.212.01.1.1]|uniref:autotransporter outer membrane beta-barrel domain-containing protein n=1 Tax=Mesorhizobium sp. M1C.F.Ca.ET.212.01.1.1 TaxID=2500527 RepID=UPI001093FFD0